MVIDMGMTDKQFNGFIRFILDDIKEVLETMEEGKEKEKLQKVADNLQQTLEDQLVNVKEAVARQIRFRAQLLFVCITIYLFIILIKTS